MVEFGSVITKLAKTHKVLGDPGKAIKHVHDRFPVAIPKLSTLALAMELRETRQVAYWDSLILAACLEASVTKLYSEDRQGSPKIRGLSIVDPFKP